MKVSGYVDERTVIAFITKLRAIDFKLQNETLVKLMRSLCQHIKEETKKRCPVDEGHLEKDIHYRTKKGNHSVQGMVYVDMAGESRDYALKMHEDDYNLGEKSRLKESLHGVEVGRKYLERALLENKDEIEVEIIKTLREFIKQCNRGRI